jgi:hypothetical protein
MSEKLGSCTNLHAAASHPELVNGEGCKVIAKQRNARIKKVVFQQGH